MRRFGIGVQISELIVWQPGKDEAQKIDSLGAVGWKNWVCLEAANVEKPVQILVRAEWKSSVVFKLSDD